MSRGSRVQYRLTVEKPHRWRYVPGSSAGADLPGSAWQLLKGKAPSGHIYMASLGDAAKVAQHLHDLGLLVKPIQAVMEVVVKHDPTTRSWVPDLDAEDNAK